MCIVLLQWQLELLPRARAVNASKCFLNTFIHAGRRAGQGRQGRSRGKGTGRGVAQEGGRGKGAAGSACFACFIWPGQTTPSTTMCGKACSAANSSCHCPLSSPLFTNPSMLLCLPLPLHLPLLLALLLPLLPLLFSCASLPFPPSCLSSPSASDTSATCSGVELHAALPAAAYFPSSLIPPPCLPH